VIALPFQILPRLLDVAGQRQQQGVVLAL